MATVFNRCYAYHKRNKVLLLSQEIRKEIGVQAMEEFKKSGLKGYWRQDSNEGDFKGKVINYTSKFTPALDKLIAAVYQKIKKDATTKEDKVSIR